MNRAILTIKIPELLDFDTDILTNDGAVSGIELCQRSTKDNMARWLTTALKVLFSGE